MLPRNPVIVSAVRTAIGRFRGSLAEVSAVQLGAVVIREALSRAGIGADAVDEVIMGNVLQAGAGQNPARQAALLAGLPHDVPSFTVNKVCGSGLKAVHLAAQSIALGEAEIVLAGGMENMSQAPYLVESAREGFKMGDRKLIDSMIRDGLWCAINDCHMGATAENVRERYGLTREQSDEFALLSQRKAAAAAEAGKFAEEIVPVPISRRSQDAVLFAEDEFIRPDTSKESLAKLRPAFRHDGTVTAGNASGMNDGAACLVLMSMECAERKGLQPLAAIRANAAAAVDPSIMGIGPVPAVNKALGKAGIGLADIGLLEVNEAFAAQSLAVGIELGWDRDKVNVNGGAIALGHPIGASGARILVTLLHEMQRRREVRYGLAALCIGGGQGIASIVENMQMKR